MSELKTSSLTNRTTSTNVDPSIEGFVSSSSPMEVYDVVVVGAGPVGLATAIGLYQRGIENILVIDQTRAFRQVGQGIDLLPNGLTALKYLDPKAYEKVKETGNKFFNPKPSNNEKTVETTQEQKSPKISLEWAQKNLKGERIRAISLKFDDWVKDYGEGRVSIAWYDLQTALRHLLPQERVKANHRCINVVDEPKNGCVRVDCISDIGGEANPYAHWENAQKDQDKHPQNPEIITQQLQKKSFRAKLVVAADGINSTVRRVLYTDSSYHAFARPEYSGYAAIGCREIYNIPNEILTELQEKFFEGSRGVTIFNDEISRDSIYMEYTRMILFQRPGGQLGYAIHFPLPLEALKENSETWLIDLALQGLEKAEFTNNIKQLVRISPPANMFQRPYYIHRATVSDALPFPTTANINRVGNPVEMEPTWSLGRVVLVGDAAHGMPPFMAQGANQGLEDALAVVTLIAGIRDKNHWDDTQAIAEAFKKYEHLRRPFMVCIQQATLKQLSHSSEQERQEYNQQVYGRNFDQLLEALL